MTNGPLAAEHLFPFAPQNGSPVRIGIALGGGGALGAAHVGVLQELHSRGIRPSIVAGTSIGSIVGAGYASGMPLSMLYRAAINAKVSSFGRHIFGRKPLTALKRFPDGPALLNSDGLLTTIESLGGDRNIEDLPRKFAVTATDVRSRQQIVMTEGPISQALRASIAVPGVFPPVRRDREWLYDGGLTENLPIRVAHSLGATHVIAVRLRPENSLRAMRIPSPPVADLETDPTTLLVTPTLQGYSQWSSKHLDKMVEAGRIAARAAIDEVLGHRVVAPGILA